VGGEVQRGLDWAGMPVIATTARLLFRHAMELPVLTPSRGVAGVGGALRPGALRGAAWRKKRQ